MWGTDFTDHFKVLGIDLNGRHPRDIPVKEVKEAWQKLAKDLHPDTFRNNLQNSRPDITPEELAAETTKAEERLKAINASYNELKTSEKIAKYAKKWDASFQGVNEAYSGNAHSSGNSRGRNNDKPRSSERQGSDGRGRRGDSGNRWQRQGFTGDDFDFGGFKRQSDKKFKEEIERHIRQARARGEAPNLSAFHLNFKDLSGMDLAGCRFPRSEIMGINFCGANLEGADLSGKKIFSCSFNHQTNLDGVNLSNSTFTINNGFPSKVKNANFSGADFGLGFPEEVTHFENCNFAKASLGINNLKDITFTNCDVSLKASHYTNFENVIFKGGKISGAFGGASTTLENVVFEGVDLAGADFSRLHRANNVKFIGSLKGLTLSDELLAKIALNPEQFSEVRIVDYFGKEIKAAGKWDKHLAKQAGIKEIPKPTQAAEAAEGSARTSKGATIAEGAAVERGFVEKLFKTAEGKIHAGKTGLVLAGTAAVGLGAFHLMKSMQRDREAPASFADRISAERNARNQQSTSIS